MDIDAILDKPNLCWAFCDCGTLVAIWTANGHCINCQTPVFARPGLTVSVNDCDCGHPEIHKNHLCDASVNLAKGKLVLSQKIAVVSKPFAAPVPLKFPILPKPHLSEVAWKSLTAFEDGWKKFKAGDPPKQKTFDLEGTRGEMMKFYTYTPSTVNMAVDTEPVTDGKVYYSKKFLDVMRLHMDFAKSRK